MPDTQTPSAQAMPRCLLVAIPVSAVDLLSKEMATQWRPDALVYNTAMLAPPVPMIAPWWLDALLAILTITLTLSTVRALAAVDARAVLALGLIVGGTFGNAASLIAGPAGVADFLDIPLTPDHGIIANGADLALWSGTALLFPVAVRLVQHLRTESVRARHHRAQCHRASRSV